MQSTYFPDETRGRMQMDWLNATYSFSFANWFDRSRLHFGQLRVLNEDRIAGGGGFGTHPHDNMEIVTLPLSGGLEHKDSMGNQGVIRAGEVQVMSAGTGITHSEVNASDREECHLLQIWVIPDARGHEPRYDQAAFPAEERQGKWQTLVAPWGSGEGLEVHQNTRFRRVALSAGQEIPLPEVQGDQGFYLFVIQGCAKVDGRSLKSGDALGMRETKGEPVTAEADSDLLLIEVPLH